ncbi:MAG: HlyD family efflux transporter periplasmic adaptor subunit [Taibaiella sp.]|nr:HlyD family efflux transporter periplasmic adaptor subunit [Taibaiella sp.]
MQEIKQIIGKDTDVSGFSAMGAIYMEGTKSKVKYWLTGALILFIIILFLPWTQNIRARGNVTTLRQENRPQQVNSIIAGRIVKWYVKEGDHVKKGDTLAQLAEIKDGYLDPNLLERTKDQMRAKEGSLTQYKAKADAITSQMQAMNQVLSVKQKQLRWKVISDSMEMIAAISDHRIAEEQLRRMRIMKDSGLASTSQLEQRIQATQSTLAKRISGENKLLNTRADLLQAQQEYNEKISKTRGDEASVRSDIANATGEVAKLTNTYANYTIRNNMYFLLAPQDGQIVQATKSGLNEIVKEGEKIAEIVPDNISYAVELFVQPVDMPLITLDQDVKFIFDGYPAIIFSGWPKASYGIFSGKVAAIESTVSDNGKFRLLIAEDSASKPWPPSLKMGIGTSAIALLNDVPIWYELWRNANGFPPEYYQSKSAKDDKKYKK